ncbi:hypothetical protein BFJ63_vAg16908 [Fusarium oxysporum f. sp. narcissi]|uniref:Uncharacterized protein n=2 Tax=Fusarium oxysporum TaxID=5507 RepID=A0A4V1RY33_FUSOX|nr:uncharacterized protein FOBCDRAFT_277783 [Fusarium oxysporum Fo47]RKK14892.1 hypothetical protein BFJ65_g11440 [Fusarium oxysporum f. sp. cepae]RKL48160.1 hypothetical protein BFJ70_g2517 [Fusarium oxysporum]RYC80206.1 hypothetical protein BFJ63_vAg16908 [Fusarium oxysporum f. sp. narcissi]RKK37418.1 hypothetical protein BFJ67_g12386 [Fusarium oxysporum f. sp. cepae]RKK39194.1 hypothetical protein BFJ66_g12095 [Fusarium oxysporum f. sp. cepae]
MFTAVGSQMPINPYITPSSSPAPKPSAKPTNIRISQTSMFLSITIKMASPTATLDASTQHYHGNPSRSDKIAIIGLTVGMAVLFLLFIVPCCCLQYLAHRQQKKEQRKEVQERATRAARLNEAAGNGSTAEQV